ncbi:hypothetical protein ACHAW5_008177 [Stephanodiscus triporus]|uniref:NADP-dependent oxidoreductase domain-containing protein n=1 Tax=Stephanodiscus triporus TaxID=2934178 RepID=A0ABD3QQQ7_9STRA
MASVVFMGTCACLLIASSFLIGKKSDPASAVKDRKARREEKTDITMPESAVASDSAIVGPLSAKDMLATGRLYILYGTAWKKDDTADLIYKAVHAGFRFVDTACQPRHYNKAGVGHGWKTAAGKMGLKRKDFFLQTKFTAPDSQDRKTCRVRELRTTNGRTKPCVRTTRC